MISTKKNILRDIDSQIMYIINSLLVLPSNSSTSSHDTTSTGIHMPDTASIPAAYPRVDQQIQRQNHSEPRQFAARVEHAISGIICDAPAVRHPVEHPAHHRDVHHGEPQRGGQAEGATATASRIRMVSFRTARARRDTHNSSNRSSPTTARGRGHPPRIIRRPEHQFRETKFVTTPFAPKFTHQIGIRREPARCVPRSSPARRKASCCAK